jgi:hypothetical protein
MVPSKEYNPPKLPLSVADDADVHPQSISRINRGIKLPGIRLAAHLARIARRVDPMLSGVDICDWLPYLLEPEIWREIVFAVKNRRRRSRRAASKRRNIQRPKEPTAPRGPAGRGSFRKGSSLRQFSP